MYNIYYLEYSYHRINKEEFHTLDSAIVWCLDRIAQASIYGLAGTLEYFIADMDTLDCTGNYPRVIWYAYRIM